MDLIIQKLLVILSNGKRYMQEQAVTSIATVADRAEDAFQKVNIFKSFRVISLTPSRTFPFIVLFFNYAHSHEYPEPSHWKGV